MSAFRISTTVKAEPLAMYSLLKSVGKFPELIPQVKKAKVLFRLPQNHQVSEWEVEIEGTAFKWKEEDIYHDQGLSWSFRMLEGDCGSFEGQWLVTPSGSISQLTLDVSFDWGIPRLGRYTGPALERKAKKNLTRVVAILRKEARCGRLPIYG